MANAKTFGEELFEEYLVVEGVSFECEPSISGVSQLFDFVIDHPTAGKVLIDLKDIKISCQTQHQQLAGRKGTFRHTYSTLLHGNGEDVKVVQELLRHGSVKVTMDVYTQAQMPAMRKAQQKVVEMMRPEASQRALAVGT